MTAEADGPGLDTHGIRMDKASLELALAVGEEHCSGYCASCVDRREALGRLNARQASEQDAPGKTVALWYVRHYETRYDLWETEAKAADYGVFLQNEDDGPHILGVQFADGRTIERDAWPEWRAAEERERARWEQNRAEWKSRPPAPVRRTLDPFGGTEPIEIELSEPSWLGRQ